MQRPSDSGASFQITYNCDAIVCFAFLFACVINTYACSQSGLQKADTRKPKNNYFIYLTKGGGHKETKHRLLAHLREIRASNSCSGVCQRSDRSTRLQHGDDDSLIQCKLLFSREPFLYLCYCHPAPLARAPAKCINQAPFTFRLQLCGSQTRMVTVCVP